MVLRGASIQRSGPAGCFPFTRRAVDYTSMERTTGRSATVASGTISGAVSSHRAIRIGHEDLRRICRLPDCLRRKGGCHVLSL